MKSTTLKIKTLSLFTAIALFVGIGMVFGFKPFHETSSGPLTEFQNVEFNYSGSDASFNNLTDEGNWSISDGTETCDLGSLPCVVAPDMSSITNVPQLVSFLENQPSEQEAETFIENKTIKQRD